MDAVIYTLDICTLVIGVIAAGVYIYTEFQNKEKLPFKICVGLLFIVIIISTSLDTISFFTFSGLGSSLDSNQPNYNSIQLNPSIVLNWKYPYKYLESYDTCKDITYYNNDYCYSIGSGYRWSWQFPSIVSVETNIFIAATLV